MDFEPEPDMPVIDEDRQKYCIKYIGQKTFEQDLLSITDFIKKNDIQLDDTDKKKEELPSDASNWRIDILIYAVIKQPIIKSNSISISKWRNPYSY
jgi:hypothetical protein